MSWRLLILILLLAAGGAALGGMQLGEYLVARAPVAAPAPGEDDNDPDRVVLDANGKPYTAQPPQPRVDGTLGVPDQPADTKWEVPTVSLFDTTTNPDVLISRNRLNANEVRELASASRGLPAGPQDVVTIDVARPGEGSHAPLMSGQQPAQPFVVSQAASQAAPDNPQQAATAAGWEGEFRRAMDQCANTGFFERPTCAWNARNKYCAPNNAWGKVDGCPRRSF
ncbi:putative exported protein [plant metagenome]|uniref:Putative exported protein n=1 Tax=plant metagenome TaxID=1297885 RepID=A0A484NXU7_9ZZZZ